jgi:hypothetical protein
MVVYPRLPEHPLLLVHLPVYVFSKHFKSFLELFLERSKCLANLGHCFLRLFSVLLDFTFKMSSETLTYMCLQIAALTVSCFRFAQSSCLQNLTTCLSSGCAKLLGSDFPFSLFQSF